MSAFADHVSEALISLTSDTGDPRERMPLVTLADRFDAYLVQVREDNHSSLLDPGFDAGILSGLSEMTGARISECMGFRIPVAHPTDLHAAARELSKQLRDSALNGRKDTEELERRLLAFSQGMSRHLGHEQLIRRAA